MNKLTIRNLMLGAVAIASLGLTACGGGFKCTDKGSCSNDVAPSSDAVAACESAKSDSKCGSKFSDLASCAKSHATCDSSGHSSINQNDCSSQQTAYANCLLGH